MKKFIINTSIALIIAAFAQLSWFWVSAGGGNDSSPPPVIASLKGFGSKTSPQYEYGYLSDIGPYAGCPGGPTVGGPLPPGPKPIVFITLSSLPEDVKNYASDQSTRVPKNSSKGFAQISKFITLATDGMNPKLKDMMYRRGFEVGPFTVGKDKDGNGVVCTIFKVQ